LNGVCRESCSGPDEAPDEHKESGEEDHKCGANHRNKDAPDNGAELLMISPTATISRPDEIFGADSGDFRRLSFCNGARVDFFRAGLINRTSVIEFLQ